MTFKVRHCQKSTAGTFLDKSPRPPFSSTSFKIAVSPNPGPRELENRVRSLKPLDHIRVDTKGRFRTQENIGSGRNTHSVPPRSTRSGNNFTNSRRRRRSLPTSTCDHSQTKSCATKLSPFRPLSFGLSWPPFNNPTAYTDWSPKGHGGAETSE